MPEPIDKQVINRAWPDSLDSKHSGGLLRLSRLLDADSVFQLILIEYNDSAYQRKIIDFLQSLYPRQIVLDATKIDSFPELEAKLQTLAEHHGPVHIIGTQHWFRKGEVEDPLRFAHGFNYHREKIAQTTKMPVLIWLHGNQLTDFAHEAPDMWAWRAMLLDFNKPVEDEPAQHVYLKSTDQWSANLDQQHKRLEEISAYLHNKEIGLSDSRLLREKANIFLSLGQLEKAKTAAAEALTIARQNDDRRAVAFSYSILADIYEIWGELDEALRIRREEELPVYERLGDVRERAVTMGRIADILRSRGELDEALRIRREEQLPVYEDLGDVRARAVTMGRIADILQSRGELDEALRIQREEELPVYEGLGDVRSRAITIGKIADILQSRGELDEALRIRQEEELPVYERLGDVRLRALTMGKIADILQSRGELDEALHIRREEELPVYARLGDVRSRALTMGQIADILQSRGELDEALRIRQEEELPVYERLGDVRSRAVAMGKIADILQSRGELDEALRIRQDEELPVYERLRDVRSLLIARANLALLLLKKNGDKGHTEAQKLLCLALCDARRLQIREEKIIIKILKKHKMLCQKE